MARRNSANPNTGVIAVVIVWLLILTLIVGLYGNTIPSLGARTTSLQITDSAGNIAGLLTTTDDGQTIFWLRNRDGTNQLSMRVGDSFSQLQLLDGTGEKRIMLEQNNDGPAVLLTNGASQASIKVTPDGATASLWKEGAGSANVLLSDSQIDLTIAEDPERHSTPETDADPLPIEIDPQVGPASVKISIIDGQIVTEGFDAR